MKKQITITPALFAASLLAALMTLLQCAEWGFEYDNPLDERGTNKKETFTDSRDGKTYAKIKIGTQTWLAVNLNYNASGSKCYGNDDSNCGKYGRLYNWETAMGGASSSDKVPSGVQGVCPSGWHIPSEAEWTALENYVGGSSRAGTKLKSKSGWDYNGNGTNEYGFSALPGGSGHSGGGFNFAGNWGYWWSSPENDTSKAWLRSMFYHSESVYRDYYDETHLYSVRCVQDD